MLDSVTLWSYVNNLCIKTSFKHVYIIFLAKNGKTCLKIKKEIFDEDQCPKVEFKAQCKNISAQALVNHNVQDIVEIKKEILKEYIYTPNGHDTADGENTYEGMNPLESKNNTNEIKVENEYLELNTTALQDIIQLNNLSPPDAHLQSLYREAPFECEFCGHCLPTKNALYKHRLRKHKNEKCFHRNLNGTPLDCPQCSRVFKTMDSLRKHIDAKHSHKHFICEHCGHKLPTKNALCQHRLRKHRDVEKGKKKVLKFKCSLCTETFTTSESLNLHKSSAHIKKPIIIEGKAWFQCEYCGHKLPTKNALCQHRLRKHRNKKVTKSSYRCVYCEIVVPSHERLQKHVLELHEALPALKQLVDKI